MALAFLYRLHGKIRSVSSEFSCLNHLRLTILQILQQTTYKLPLCHISRKSECVLSVSISRNKIQNYLQRLLGCLCTVLIKICLLCCKYAVQKVSITIVQVDKTVKIISIGDRRIPSASIGLQRQQLMWWKGREEEGKVFYLFLDQIQFSVRKG